MESIDNTRPFIRAGSTAVTALLIEFVNEKLQPTHRKLWVANVGDARAVLK